MAKDDSELMNNIAEKLMQFISRTILSQKVKWRIEWKNLRKIVKDLSADVSDSK